ncbi:FxsA family protein [Phycicoccus sp. HDW14]|uniref:FxsA family protein n=1 Tax=Phycicoccus sp. HDW14 TaxID=2714941 RepID=UPI00140D6BAA|nr:FxsA family protein [Phycicoccus sp. HDW14]QIM20846.1 FxsA family protein [Phycicoccus sp. HDW14]
MTRPGATPYAGRGRRGRLVRRLLVVVLVLVPLVEVATIVLVGRTIGGWPTVLLLLLTSVLGAWVIRKEGARAWGALREALRSGRMPARELADGVLVLVGGVLLLVPGFVTDVLGLLVILPWTRPIARIWLEAVVARRLFGAFGGGPGRPGDGPPDVVQGQIVD